ncbi:MAG: hypothetical protein K9G49_08980 [Taibaiella sp.]|nr:hypothetical protein [Taibaiella sp.]
MPKFTIIDLINGKDVIIQYYKNAKEIWEEIINSDDFSSIDKLVKMLEFSQTRFENECGGKYLGREIMAFVGVGQFYNDLIGFDNNYDDVIKVRDAVSKSYCSIELKWYFDRAIYHFGLNEVKSID